MTAIMTMILVGLYPQLHTEQTECGCVQGYLLMSDTTDNVGTIGQSSSAAFGGSMDNVTSRRLGHQTDISTALLQVSPPPLLPPPKYQSLSPRSCLTNMTMYTRKVSKSHVTANQQLCVEVMT